MPKGVYKRRRRKKKTIVKTSIPAPTWRLLNSGQSITGPEEIGRQIERLVAIADKLTLMGETKLAKLALSRVGKYLQHA